MHNQSLSILLRLICLQSFRNKYEGFIFMWINTMFEGYSINILILGLSFRSHHVVRVFIMNI